MWLCWKWDWKWKIDYIDTTIGVDMGTNIITKIGHGTMMVICFKQHLDNIWSSVNEKVTQ